MRIETNAPFPNRIQFILEQFEGPLLQNGPLGLFDPRRDLEVYVDGVLTPIITFTYDSANNRYLLYTQNPFNLQGVIQVVHHMPTPPFGYGTDEPTADTPTFSPVTGTYTSAQTVTISDTTVGADIFYTTDGATPTTSATIYTVPITVATTTTVKAIAKANGFTESAVATAVYTIAPAPMGFGETFGTSFGS